MFHFNRGVAYGLAVGFAAAVATIFTIVTAKPTITPLHSDRPSLTVKPIQELNRSSKVDRAPLNLGNDQELQKSIVTVEVVGVHDTAVVYKDRDGQVLFSTDPVSNVTIVAKNLTLPEVTIRDSNDSTIDQIPLERTKPLKPRNLLKSGCESGLGTDVDPAEMIGAARCVAQVGNPSRVVDNN
jgi:hypothetical protein